MSGVGIGLGAFASGLSQGWGLGLNIEETRARRAERERANQQQKQVDTFDQQADAEFNRRVEAGQARPEDAYKFWASYAAPRKATLLAQQGRYADANELLKWTESDAARQGSKLFASSLFKAQSGDLRGAIDDAVAAGKVKGYLDHSYQVENEQPITGKNGQITGYRVTLRDADGRPLEWEVTPDNVVDGIATLFNPEAAFQTHLDARAARQEAELEVDTYGKKEAIKDRFERGRNEQQHQFKLKEAAAGGGSAPAEVQAAEWLAAQVAAAENRAVTPKDKLEAHKVIRQAKDDPSARAGLVLRAYEALAKDPYDDRTPAEKQAAAAEYVDSLIAETPEAGAAPSPPAPGLGMPGPAEPALGTMEKPFKPMTDADYESMPPGAVYIDPDDGTLRKKGGQ